MCSNESDEDDYMSDAFLLKCANDRPGLLTKKDVQQHINKEKEKQHKTKPHRVLETEKRDEGMNNVITSENKGFLLLQKMGYKPGMVLGKRGTGISEPIPIQVKTGRGGLGRESELKRKQHEVSEMRTTMAIKRKRMDEHQNQDYRQHLSQKYSDHEVESDLYKSQKVCEQLDSEKDICEPGEFYYWPQSRLQKESRDSDEEEVEDDVPLIDIPSADKLEALTYHLRTTYLYCVWCGYRFDDEQDMEANCPGDSADAHHDT